MRSSAIARRRQAAIRRRISVDRLVDLEKALELADAGGVAHFAEGLGFDLADALAGDLELLADFLEGAGVAVAEAETQLETLRSRR